MKFRVLFIIFNVVILASFALVFLMPAFVLGWEYTSVFWSGNWPVGAVFLLVLAGLNGYFVYNWRVFTLLEQEDWNALISYLEESAYERTRVSRQRARILVNAYVVTGQLDRIRDLEAFVRAQKPRLLAKLPLEFGLPYLLSNDGAQMIEYFGPLRDEPRVSQPTWVRWCYAFGLMSDSRFDEARAELVAVIQESRDLLLRTLTAHMLEPFGAQDEATAQLVATVRSELRARHTRNAIDRELERQRQNLQVLFLSSRIEEARDWVFRS
jgi:hypothetical protein